ncbi:MAG: hypothetical protein KAT77_04420 [Nanoarchaeota archaeon]|nr:hypothetical protein [Nanoarchaeota archaeon]
MSKRQRLNEFNLVSFSLKKRGQITVFIIVGVVILLAFIAIFAIRSYVIRQEVAEVARPIAEELPGEFEALRVFTENCIETVAERGLIRLGQQGGYIYPRTWAGMEFDETNPTDSDGLAFPGSDLRVPYWWYNNVENEQNRIALDSKRPSVDDMEDDLARYVDLELARCLDGYSSFVPLGFEVEEEGFVTRAEIVPGIVKFLVSHPLTIKKGAGEAELENFYVEIDVELLHMYEIASLIAESQQNYSFLEQHTLNLIEIFSDVDENKLPPMTDNTFEDSENIKWKKEEVVEDLKVILMSYIPFLRYYQSANYVNYEFPAGTPLKDMHQRVYNNMILPLGGAEDLEVRFQYLDLWEPYISFNSEGDFIESTKLGPIDFFIDEFTWYRYNTVYDISYPIFVSLNSPESFNGEGYFFNFALETNIRNNQAVEPGSFVGLISDYEESLLCNPEQRASGEITVRVIDAYTNEPIPEATVYFSDEEETCSMGSTDSDGILKESFPIMIGGSVSAAKERYLMRFERLDVRQDTTGLLEIKLWPFKDVELGVFKKKLFNCKVKGGNEVCYYSSGNLTVDNPLHAALLLLNKTILEEANSGVIEGSSKADVSIWRFSNAPVDLEETDEVAVVLQRLSDDEKPFSIGSYVLGTDFGEIRLVPGTYEVTLALIANKDFIIPDEERCFDDECFNFDGIFMENVPAGGLIWKDGVTWELKPSDLYGAERLNFFVLYPAVFDIPEEARILEDLTQMGQTKNNSIIFKERLQPVFT